MKSTSTISIPSKYGSTIECIDEYKEILADLFQEVDHDFCRISDLGKIFDKDIDIAIREIYGKDLYIGKNNPNWVFEVGDNLENKQGKFEVVGKSDRFDFIINTK